MAHGQIPAQQRHCIGGKGRFSVRRVEKKDKTLVGFREPDPRFVADLRECHTVVPEIGFKISALSALVDSMDARRVLPQIEFIAGDAAIALVVRHLAPLVQDDLDILTARCTAAGWMNDTYRLFNA